MLAFTKPAADFSMGCAGKRIGHSLFATYPTRLAIHEWLYASMPCPVILVAAKRYSPLLYLVLGNKPRTRE
jgi:hypothetical protein